MPLTLYIYVKGQQSEQQTDSRYSKPTHLWDGRRELGVQLAAVLRRFLSTPERPDRLNGYFESRADEA